MNSGAGQRTGPWGTAAWPSATGEYAPPRITDRDVSTINRRPWGRSKPEDADTNEVVTNVFRAWRSGHPEGSLRQFWRAVAAGDDEIPVAFDPCGDRRIDTEQALSGLHSAPVGGPA